VVYNRLSCHLRQPPKLLQLQLRQLQHPVFSGSQELRDILLWERLEQASELPCRDNVDLKALVHRNDSDGYDLRVSYGVANEIGVVQVPKGENSLDISPAAVVNAEERMAV